MRTGAGWPRLLGSADCLPESVMRLALLAAAPIVSILLGFATPATAAETRIPERALA